MRRLLVTGARGQIGSELVPALRSRYGVERVIASDLGAAVSEGPWEHLDCTDLEALRSVMLRHEVGEIYHLAAVLSAVAESDPGKAWRLNMASLENVLTAARELASRVFFPSSIAVFGPSTPRINTPQLAIQRPVTIYGVTKVAGELLCDYYATRFGVDVRGLRLPGLISYVAPPGGGTTDYAVEMLRAAARGEGYSCFLAPETRLDMMYMPDAVAAIIQLMEASAARLKHRTAYNVAAMSVTPAELAAEIRERLPQFILDYCVDPLRQSIADSWPQSLDVSAARDDWGFAPRFGLSAMTQDMLCHLAAQAQSAKARPPGGTSDAERKTG
ncbi:NAD-dependent epimerase/dehydratase family protein [Methylocystis bryophila]|uniref:UDP-glucose 4-epimerase n=1 Tax=Methylocystis bryophila TaxID=655015 RepID=A0A1W6MUD0_9HYPH|nr:NAD-dependent epimerase/dehydratase family protein [Methylocystis bryophila]ARN81218.1 UDP-glucose 4-epimerase [Methylocystis bryophila]BDV37164.1 L-threonine 3-dehydrogenase [Methylocystis bryophila]